MMHSQPVNDLAAPAAAQLVGSASIAELAQREGCAVDSYTLALVKRIGVSDLTFHQQVTRLQALAGIATNASPDSATADELARHYVISYALFERFSLLAGDCAAAGKTRAAGIYMTAAASAQRSNLAVLNALETMRQQSKQSAAEALPG